MSGKLLNSLQLKGFLSFGPESQPVELTNLNVLIGPNGVGKSNFIEAIELLHATPTDLPGAIRAGGRPMDWLWKVGSSVGAAIINARLAPSDNLRELVYHLAFTETGNRVEIVDETLEEAEKRDRTKSDVFFYYRFQKGQPVINVREFEEHPTSSRMYFERRLQRESINPEQSVLKQKRDDEHYPELFHVAQHFEQIQIFREWGFGRSATLRMPQPADLPTDSLLPKLENLGLVLNGLEHTAIWPRFEEMMSRFLPRFKRLSTKVVSGGAVQVYLHEDGVQSPLPATRLSDGTLRFMSLLAILLNAESASLLCIEEPELGLHPDAMSLLADLLTEASEKTQLIVTTHSDVLVSALTEQAESVLVCDYLENGTTLHRLEAEKLELWLKDYRLGDIWRSGKVGGNLW
jgi:predicted ATPase